VCQSLEGIMATYSEPGYEGGGGSGSVPVPLPSFLGMGHVTGQDFAGITALSAGKRKEEDTRERERERESETLSLP